jgi:hypothetical protein
MSKFSAGNFSVFGYLFGGTLLMTLGVYILRGLGLLALIPGGVILGLMLLTVVTGILYGVMRNRRF